jgi:hypothetical protein
VVLIMRKLDKNKITDEAINTIKARNESFFDF